VYKHLLVPIDGSPLSTSLVDQAIAFVRGTDARLTFFHARPDLGATGDGALLRTVSPTSFSQSVAGNSQLLLAKAQAAARAAGVPSEAVATISDRPHDSILDTATERGCDLVFMASHGRRGLKGVLLGSVTQKVLQRATIPVLVAAVESNLPQSDAQRALSVIKDEHRSLSAVIHGLQRVVARACTGGERPDFQLLNAMLFYIEQFPERLHHPKEDAYLFRLLRARTHEFDAVIDELQRQHQQGAALFAALRAALSRYEQLEPDGADAFFEAVEQFARAQWQHMGAEEKVILPAAAAHLNDEDWRVIAAAFLDNADPRFGLHADEPFEQLCTRLLDLGAAASLETPPQGAPT
jgi:nucleotide-binding universal stress UspA family protein/hemerythrin-like domain-containing protein